MEEADEGLVGSSEAAESGGWERRLSATSSKKGDRDRRTGGTGGKV